MKLVILVTKYLTKWYSYTLVYFNKNTVDKINTDDNNIAAMTNDDTSVTNISSDDNNMLVIGNIDNSKMIPLTLNPNTYRLMKLMMKNKK